MTDPRAYLDALRAAKADPRYDPMVVGCGNCHHDIEVHDDYPDNLGCLVCGCTDVIADEEDLAFAAEPHWWHRR